MATTRRPAPPAATPPGDEDAWSGALRRQLECSTLGMVAMLESAEAMHRFLLDSTRAARERLEALRRRIHETREVPRLLALEGDLWRVGVGGGVAQRLTTHPEEESRPAVSPDGRTVAYAATYDGPGEVYTLPLEGGAPARQTWDASRPAWVTWTPKGEILFATRRHSTLAFGSGPPK